MTVDGKSKSIAERKMSIVSLGLRLLSRPNVSLLLPIRWNALNTILVVELVVLFFYSLSWPLCSIHRRCGHRALKPPNQKDSTPLSTKPVVSPCVTGWSLLVRWIWSISFCRLSFPSLPSSLWTHWSFTNQANMIVSSNATVLNRQRMFCTICWNIVYDVSSTIDVSPRCCWPFPARFSCWTRPCMCWRSTISSSLPTKPRTRRIQRNRSLKCWPSTCSTRTFPSTSFSIRCAGKTFVLAWWI